MREQMDEDELKKVIKLYPHTRQADTGRLRPHRQQALRRLAGLAQMPGEGSRRSTRNTPTNIPDGPRTAQALYQAVYRASRPHRYVQRRRRRQKSRRCQQPRPRPGRPASKPSSPNPTTRLRAGALVYKLDQGVPVYGIDQELTGSRFCRLLQPHVRPHLEAF